MKRYVIERSDIIVLFVIVAWASPFEAFAGSSTNAAAAVTNKPDGQVILDTFSFWRCHVTLRAPLFDVTGGVQTAASTNAVKAPERPHTPLPPADWIKPEFDDNGWWRDTGPFFGGTGNGTDRSGQTQQIGLMCLRGKFTVTDPAKVKDLKLSLVLRGGVIVYLNGTEIGRTGMPSGPCDFETPADRYPPDAFFNVAATWKMKKEEVEARYLLRMRNAAMVVPVRLLRKGLNVLAVEMHRSPMKPYPPRFDMRGAYNFSTCGLDSISLLSAMGDAVVPNFERPAGFQVWNADLLQLVTPVDYGDPHERVHPVPIVGTRAGEFSGQVVVSSDAAIKGLKVDASDLRGRDGKSLIPAARLKVRYPRNMRLSISYMYLHPRFRWRGQWNHDRWGGSLGNFDALDEEAPKEIAVYDVGKAVEEGRQYKWGAVQPIWITVAVPADAATGDYSGKVTIKAEGVQPVDVPVELHVEGWKMPDPKTFSTIVDIAQSPESLSLYYDVPLWSEKHWGMIERTFRLLGSVGNDVIYVPLVGETNLGNEHTMVRWTKQGDGTCKCDFSIVEKYLDLAGKHMGKLRVVCFHVWDYNLGGDITFGRMYSGQRGKEMQAKSPEVQVSAVTKPGEPPATIKVPFYVDEEGKKAWKPLTDELCRIVKKRSLSDSATLGMGGDILPNKAVVAYWKEAFPDSKWMIQGHGGGGHGSVAEVPPMLHGVPVNYVSIVYGARFQFGDPANGRMYGWKPKAQINTLFSRGLYLAGDVAPPAASRLIAEWNITGGQAGIGRLTADFFKIASKDGKSTLWLPRRYPQSNWGNAGARTALFAPGSDGPLSTTRFDIMREGIQECEARIFLEKALTDDSLRGKMGDALAIRIQDLLDDRTRANMWVFEYDRVIDYNIGARAFLLGGAMDINWYAASGWRDRTKALFAAAAEVTAALGK